MLNTKKLERLLAGNLQKRTLLSRHTDALLQTLYSLRNLISSVNSQLRSFCIRAF
jgi:hypothetical protein